MTPFSLLLQALGRDELLAIADHVSIPVADRRAKAPLLAAVAGIKRLRDLGDSGLRERREILKRATQWDDFSSEAPVSTHGTDSRGAA
jgi:hypothetical protein